MQSVQAVQTDAMTAEQSVNTEPGWESEVAAMFDYSNSLSEQHDKLRRQQEEEEAEHHKQRQQVQKKKEEVIRQHQALLQKLDSVRVKLQLNDSKATRKIFLAKNQEMTSEKDRAEEERNRLAKELEESERKLRELTEEKREEQEKWQEELEELRKEMEQARKEATEAELLASQDEITAVEKRREYAMTCIEAWLRTVGEYLSALRVDFPQQFLQERQEWEKQEGVVRRNQAELQNRFQEVLHQLQQGRDLESLPKINVPSLPLVPTAELKVNQMIQSLTRPQFTPPPPIPGSRAFPPQRPPHPFQQQHHPQYRLRYPHQYPPQGPPPHQHQPQGPPPHQHQGPPPHQHQFQQHFRAPVRVGLSPSPPVQPPYPVTPPPSPVSAPTPSASSGKLDKVLEKLGALYPQCTRAELTALLQQVKSARGTLAGMSMDEVVDQVGVRLALYERSAPPPGPVGRPAPPGPIQRPTAPPQRGGAAVGGIQASGALKFCLMCQKHVEPESRQPLSCSHSVHRDCIRIWLQSSKNNSCPFCPTK